MRLCPFPGVYVLRIGLAEGFYHGQFTYVLITLSSFGRFILSSGVARVREQPSHPVFIFAWPVTEESTLLLPSKKIERASEQILQAHHQAS
jgi:hypothetical protein